MESVCRVCRRSAARQDCYVRLETEDHPACRPCWEQAFLDPRRILRVLRNPPKEGPDPAAN